MEFVALIVTYNRLRKLKMALAAYDDQTRPVDKIIVVDNGSDLETKLYLKEWEQKETKSKKIIVTLNPNIGGSGGYYYGMKKAIELGFDWLWLADDDAYPHKDVFEKLENKIENSSYKVFCGKVYNNNTIQYDHRKTVNKGLLKVKEIDSKKDDYEKEAFDVDIFSFVGCCLSFEVVKSCGLSCKEYYIWCDDVEYSYRIRKNYKILCIPSVEIYHDCDESNGHISWKSYYGNRNRLDLCKRHFSKLQFYYEVCIIKLRILKNFFTNKNVYKLLRSSYIDYKRHRFGMSDVYKTGTKIE